MSRKPRDMGHPLVGTPGASPELVLEQAVEGFAGVVGTGGAGTGGSLLFDTHTNRIELAFVACVFLGHALGNRLQTLEPLRRIEIGALFARMQLKAAFRALAERFG